MNEDEAMRRLIDLESRVRKLEEPKCIQRVANGTYRDYSPHVPDKPQPQPAPVTLVEAVEEFNKFCNDNMTPRSGRYEFLRNVMIQALAAEKRRQELVTTLINYAKDYRGGLPTLVAQALRNLDAFDKERGA